MPDSESTLLQYVLAFIVFGAAGTLTFWLGERSSARQLKDIRSVNDEQTLELTETMLRTHGVVMKLDSLSSAIHEGDTNPRLLQELRSETQHLAKAYDQWAAISTRRAALVKSEIDAGRLSAAAKAKDYSLLVGPYYAFFIESLGRHIEALQSTGRGIHIREVAELPDPIVKERDPVIDGSAQELVQYVFPSGRKWTVIISTGGASESSLRLPYLWVALAKSDDQSNGPNYFEVNMRQTNDHGLVFNILSNFDAVKSRAQAENRPLEEFRSRIDSMLQALLEIEVGHDSKENQSGSSAR